MKVFQLSPATEWRPKVAHGEIVGFAVNMNQAPERGGRFFFRPIFCRPIRGLKFFFAIQPTVSQWATFCRTSGALVALILFFAVGATAETTNILSDAEIQGRNLARQLFEQSPITNSIQNGVLEIRGEKKTKTDVPIEFKIIASALNDAIDWETIYETTTESNQVELIVNHKAGKPNAYLFMEGFPRLVELDHPVVLSGSRTMRPFANSDFWICDLGLEFFHWPVQKILPNTTTLKRGRSYTLLESTNPNPSTNGYSRVLSWIDKESGGILEAEAYDVQGKLLKDFAPKSFKKVNGQWELQEMEIRNVQTGSRTRLEFDLKK